MCCSPFRHVKEWSLAMHLKHLLFMLFTRFCDAFLKVFIVIFFPLKFGKVTSVLRKLYPGSPLNYWVKVLLLLALGHWTDISWEQWVRNVPQWDEVTNPETLVDSILLLISEFIQHATHVGYLVMIWDLGASLLTVLTRSPELVIRFEVIFLLLNAVDARGGTDVALWILTSSHL